MCLVLFGFELLRCCVVDLCDRSEEDTGARKRAHVGAQAFPRRSAVGAQAFPRRSGADASGRKVDARFVHASGLGHQLVADHAPYDLVFANILARPLVSLAGPIKGALKPGGIAILSGLLRTQERYVRAAYLARGFRLTARVRRDAWATLVLTRGSR